ncbi:hypothetical protein AAFF_G00106780 [Aldrovandia affinis]|uniref:Uncharacterized protein n=1 Tax=Aldrovandia affinis TaxID=143900 RepID=A0AAD7WXC9_9TELE|nr:hypothetical protein AAFF_G00106780 [Aldrovandia affinis]
MAYKTVRGLLLSAVSRAGRGGPPKLQELHPELHQEARGLAIKADFKRQNSEVSYWSDLQMRRGSAEGLGSKSEECAIMPSVGPVGKRPRLRCKRCPPCAPRSLQMGDGREASVAPKV